MLRNCSPRYSDRSFWSPGLSRPGWRAFFGNPRCACSLSITRVTSSRGAWAYLRAVWRGAIPFVHMWWNNPWCPYWRSLSTCSTGGAQFYLLGSSNSLTRKKRLRQQAVPAALCYIICARPFSLVCVIIAFILFYARFRWQKRCKPVWRYNIHYPSAQLK